MSVNAVPRSQLNGYVCSGSRELLAFVRSPGIFGSKPLLQFLQRFPLRITAATDDPPLHPTIGRAISRQAGRTGQQVYRVLELETAFALRHRGRESDIHGQRFVYCVFTTGFARWAVFR